MKYNFFTGENAKKVIYKGYKYLGKGKLGKLKFETIDGKRFYYLVDYFSNYSKISPKTSNKSKFKKMTIEDWKYKGDWFAEKNYIEKQKAKKELIFNTKIKHEDKRFMASTIIKFGKDYILLSDLCDSNIIRDLQLKDGDKLKITITKFSTSMQKEKVK